MTPKLATVAWGGALALILLVTGCTVGPNYHRPTAPVTPEFKETAGWQPAQPVDQLGRGNWWEDYGDPELNALEEQVNVSNQSLKIAVTQYTQARAEVQYQRANYFPFLSMDPGVSRSRGSYNRGNYFSGSTNQYNDFTLPLDVSWEPDIWGKIRRTVESARATAQASAADVVNVRLSLQAELALDYFEMRGLDAQKLILDQTTLAYQKSLDLTLQLLHSGLGSQLAVAQARTQLQTTQAQDQDVGVARAQFEHAIAVLSGQPPATLNIPIRALGERLPVVPAGLPSQLLERRPDIAAAERQMQSANAQIGIARSAYYPNFQLTGVGGFDSGHPGDWFTGPSSLWSVGLSAFEPLIDWGQRHALNTQAQANYEGTVANYRQTVLGAYQEVEDNLAALRILQGEAQTQNQAVGSAQQQEQIATTLYKSGLEDYLTVITAQSVELSNKLTATQIQTRRMTASVLLIKALGGGWNANQLPHN